MAVPQEVPFAIAHTMQPFRLLELPQELLDLIESSNPPTLHLKSSAPATGTSANAVLCTPDKTYQLRQVQTSNSLYVAQSAPQPGGNDEQAVHGVCAIGTCAVTLELLPEGGSALPPMRDALPVYDKANAEFDAEENGKSKDAVFADIPFSEAECERAWTGLFAFEAGGSSCQASSRSLALAWSAINAAALAEGIKLDGQFFVEDMARLLEDEGHPPGLVRAVCRGLAVDGTASGDWCCLDKVKTINFAGKTLLQARQGTPDFTVDEFLDAWRDCLPEDWRGDVNLAAIQGEYELPTSATIRAKATASSSAPAITSTSRPSASRKWHERFAKTRTK